MNNFVKKYNQKNSLIFISSYPERGVKYSGRVCALGGFCKNTVNAFKKRFKDKKIIVLTLTTNAKQEIYEEENILIIRCFKRNQPFSYFSLIGYLLKFNKVRNILVEFEFASFGNTLTTGLFPLVLYLAKLLNKKVSLVLHQVIFDLAQLTGHLGFKSRTWRLVFFTFLLRLFYFFLCLPVQNIIVLEQEFKNRLEALIKNKKIFVIPHGADNSLKKINKMAAREKLGFAKNKKIALYFGYLTWYKGVDWLIENFPQSKNWQLVIAGGPSFTQKEKSHYQKYLKKVYQLASEKNIKITGFLKEKEIPLYFSSADLAVLPYRSFMSSSGPLSLAISFAKPFILSQPMIKILNTSDFQEVLKQRKLNKKDFVFSLKKESLERLFARIHLKKLANFSQSIKQKRAFKKIAKKYAKLL